MQHDGNDHRTDLVKYRLEKAASDLKSAEILFDADDLRGSNNRAYYSIFDCIQAIHAMDGHGYKRHKDALGNFNKEYVKENIFPRELGRRIAEAQDVRHASDYDDFYVVSRVVTKDQIQTAKDLLEQAEKYCEAREYGIITKEELEERLKKEAGKNSKDTIAESSDEPL